MEQTKLPDWRIDNKWAWLGSLLISVIVTTATVTIAGLKIYYEMIGDIRDIKKDVSYTAKWTVEHDITTAERVKNFQALDKRVIKLETLIGMGVADASAALK